MRAICRGGHGEVIRSCDSHVTVMFTLCRSCAGHVTTFIVLLIVHHCGVYLGREEGQEQVEQVDAKPVGDNVPALRGNRDNQVTKATRSSCACVTVCPTWMVKALKQ